MRVVTLNTSGNNAEDKYEKLKKGEITERIKIFEDACKEINIVFDEQALIDLGFSVDEIAYRKLKIITEALNQQWKADYKDGDQKKWVPWFKISPSGLVFRGTNYCCSNADAGYASRLCFPSEALAAYAGKTFTEIYSKFIV